MGLSISSLLKHFLGKEDVRILMVGLDNAGKTTILYQLKVGEVITTIPTIGFNVETVEYKNIRFTVWDIGGQHKIRSLWYHYFLNSAAIIYVVDSTDVNRLPESAEEMRLMMEKPELKDTVLLVLANKQDLPNALNVSQLVNKLELHKIQQDWHIHATCATSGNGLYDALDILKEMLNKRRSRLSN